MSLIKNFEFKGLFQAGRKMAAPLGYFRRFTNAYKDKSGRVCPYSVGLGGGNNPDGDWGTGTIIWAGTVFSSPWYNGFFELIKATNGRGGYKHWNWAQGNMPVNQPYNLPYGKGMYSPEAFSAYVPAGCWTSCRIREKLYFLESVQLSEFHTQEDLSAFPRKRISNLMRFDGEKVERAGLPTPWYNLTPNNAGNANLRTVYMTCGHDGELIFSNYLQYKVTAGNLTNFQIGGYNGVNKLADPVGMTGTIFPKQREPNDWLYDFEYPGLFGAAPNYYNRRYIQLASATYTASVGMAMTAGYNSPLLEVGDWLMTVNPAPIPGTIHDAFYFKIKSIAGSVFTMDPVIKAYNTQTASWDLINLDYAVPKGYVDMAAFIARLVANLGLSNIWTIVSASLDANGTLPYNVVGIRPIFWESTSFTTINTAFVDWDRNMLGIITQDMSGWYQHTVVKTNFPDTIKGITNFSDLLVAFDDNALYFTDVSYGGSTEMVSGISNLIPNGSEFGKIVAICGSEDFLLISRESKNYVLRGEITTGNVSITECDVAVPGAANARAVSNAFIGQVMLMNNTGIYSVSSSGNITDISIYIKDLFLGKSPDGNPFDPSVMKTPVQILSNSFDGGVMKISLDEVRGFVVFLTGKFEKEDPSVKGANCLVYDTNDGSWYEWSYSAGGSVASIEFFDGRGTTLGYTMSREDGVLRETQILATQWYNMGEPSLEKQVTMINFYGKLLARPANPNSKGLRIMQQNNWAPFLTGEKVTDVYYPPEKNRDVLQDGYVHNQRLDNSKARVTSIIFMDAGSGGEHDMGGGFELEGFELEVFPVQEGTKKGITT